MKCFYCKQSLGITESYYNIRELHKSKGSANRWKIVGQCCETCYDAGHKVTLEKGK